MQEQAYAAHRVARVEQLELSVRRHAAQRIPRGQGGRRGGKKVQSRFSKKKLNFQKSNHFSSEVYSLFALWLPNFRIFKITLGFSGEDLPDGQNDLQPGAPFHRPGVRAR